MGYHFKVFQFCFDFVVGILQLPHSRPPMFFFFSLFSLRSVSGRLVKKPRRPRSIHYVSGRKVDVGGEGPIFKYVRTKLESEFLTGQDSNR